MLRRQASDMLKQDTEEHGMAWDRFEDPTRWPPCLWQGECNQVQGLRLGSEP
jgi:hypothetical protein